MRISFKVCRQCHARYEKEGLEQSVQAWSVGASGRVPAKRGVPWGIRKMWRVGRMWCPYAQTERLLRMGVTSKRVPEFCPNLMEHAIAWARRKS